MFLSNEKQEGIVAKMIGHSLDILTQRKSYTDYYTH